VVRQHHAHAGSRPHGGTAQNAPAARESALTAPPLAYASSHGHHLRPALDTLGHAAHNAPAKCRRFRAGASASECRSPARKRSSVTATVRTAHFGRRRDAGAPPTLEHAG